MEKQIREVRVKDLFKFALLPPVIIAVIWLITALVLVKYISAVPSFIFYIAAGIATYYPLKRFAIGAVLMYKAFAPLEVRARCRFHPSCSTYMIMAINKYGLFIGVIKGIGRLCRCKPPNGGEDYP